FDLGDGHSLTFAYCDGPPEILDSIAGALPFSVALGRVPGNPAILPPRRGPALRTPLLTSTELAIDLDVDAANALLYELWRTGYLDKQLAKAGLDHRFNSDPVVKEFLS